MVNWKWKWAWTKFTCSIKEKTCMFHLLRKIYGSDDLSSRNRNATSGFQTLKSHVWTGRGGERAVSRPKYQSKFYIGFVTPFQRSFIIKWNTEMIIDIIAWHTFHWMLSYGIRNDEKRLRSYFLFLSDNWLWAKYESNNARERKTSSVQWIKRNVFTPIWF